MFTSAETLAHIKDSLIHRQKLSSEPAHHPQSHGLYHEHFTDPIGREDVAHHAGSVKGIFALLYPGDWLSLIHYVARYRIQQAKQLLNTSDMSITDIAMEVGFSDSNYFSRAFRREVGFLRWLIDTSSKRRTWSPSC